ncbi:PaaI family thioesterase [Caulobacter sp. SLTY]|uniref:PaaI family thioesterase n=1 Tax=Caulobacter sp. SLTY TaxID=2683262 RepID=UPI001F0FC49A|nr:PaaI family thioesterase [Caulobacter sp. SLTY]
MKVEPMTPEGFEPHFRKSGLTDPWEPIYSRRVPGEAVIIGLRAGQAHVNSRGLVHGGLIAAMADNAMGLSCVEQAEPGSLSGLLTASMTTDYVGVAKVGQWLEFTTGFVKVGRSICFAQCFVTADGKPCARANATFSVVRAA